MKKYFLELAMIMILDIWQEIHPRQFWIELNVIYSVGKGVFWIECYLPGWEGYFTSFLLQSFINIKSLVRTSALFKYIFFNLRSTSRFGCQYASVFLYFIYLDLVNEVHDQSSEPYPPLLRAGACQRFCSTPAFRNIHVHTFCVLYID